MIILTITSLFVALFSFSRSVPSHEGTTAHVRRLARVSGRAHHNEYWMERSIRGSSKYLRSEFAVLEQTRETPVVAGTNMLVEEEMNATVPLFIDAFLNAERNMVFIILSFTPMAFLNRTLLDRVDWKKTKWVCQWNSEHEVEQIGEQLGLNLDSQPGVVVACPRSSDSRLGVLNLRGSFEGAIIYHRQRINVSKEPFVKPGSSLILCTMIRDGYSSGDIPSWIRYHLGLGVQQILLYMDSQDSSVIRKSLKSFWNDTRITMIPFFFGSVARKRLFMLQASAENHCLYQGKGRTKWIAHADVDEYFEAKLGNRNLGSLLDSQKVDTALVVAPTTRFSCRASTLSRENFTFPCDLNCRTEFNQLTSKAISRPDNVSWLSPHGAIVHASMKAVNLQPNQLQVNHFKKCRVDDVRSISSTCPQNSQIEHASFHEVCRNALEREYKELEAETQQKTDRISVVREEGTQLQHENIPLQEAMNVNAAGTTAGATHLK